jgi:8-oxo-dGTP pyrophosphatase MutT (NUDIX family)
MATLPRLAHRLMRLKWRITRPLTVGVKVLLVRDEEVLLVRHSYQDLWFLPGGGVKKGETFEAAVRREAREEVGGALRDLRLHGVFSNFSEAKSDHIAVFVCTDFTVEPDGSWEIEAAQFFPLDALPPDCANGERRRIGEYLDGHGPYFGRW